LELEGVFSERAKENQTLSSGAGVKGCQKSDNLSPIDTKKELAKVANVSHDTIAKVKKIQSTATQEEKYLS
jgi:outer membrane lipoprotein SlyB